MTPRDIQRYLNGKKLIREIAKENPRLSTVERLMADADVNAQNEHGQTPLLVAARFGHVDIAKRLLDAGADINLRGNSEEKPKYGDGNDRHDTALIAAVYYGRDDFALMLIGRGADVNLQCVKCQFTALMWAARDGKRIDVLKALLDAGADDKLKDHSGMTAFDWAHVETNYFKTQENIALLTAKKNGTYRTAGQKVGEAFNKGAKGRVEPEKQINAPKRRPFGPSGTF